MQHFAMKQYQIRNFKIWEMKIDLKQLQTHGNQDRNDCGGSRANFSGRFADLILTRGIFYRMRFKFFCETRSGLGNPP